MCTSAIRASSLSFHSLQDSPALTDELTIAFFVLSLTTDQAAVVQTALKYLRRGKGGISGYDKGEGEVPAARHTLHESVLLVS